jgi:hypothetical protein
MADEPRMNDMQDMQWGGPEPRKQPGSDRTRWLTSSVSLFLLTYSIETFRAVFQVMSTLSPTLT